MTLDPDLLSTFLAVLEHGGIAPAGRATHVSQPAVSARIRRLEQSLGATLFTRSAQGVEPTAAGQRLAGHAREIQRMLEHAAADVGGTREPERLSIVASTTIAAQVLPLTLAAYRRRFPDVELRVRVVNTQEVVEAVRSGRFSLGLVEGHRRVPAVRLEPWLEDELQLVVGRDVPAGWRVRRPADLERVPLLWREPGSGTRAVISRALRGAGARSKPQPGDLVLGSNEAITSGIGAGLGLGFLSRWGLAPHIQSGRLMVAPGFSMTVRRTFHWALPSGSLASSAQHFRDFASNHPPVAAQM